MNEHICQLITTETEAQELLNSSTKAYLEGTQEWMWVTTKQLNQMLIESPDSKLKTVRNKYSHPIHFSVAKTKPLPSTAFPV